ncbi:MAG: hypothetical protein HOB81_04160 [Flavobacteriaceae bacterium]|nr:hypothetical protein [Flavobacteriaceae bacterium]
MTNNEIDLSETMNCIWANKWKVILITFVTVIISLFFKLNSKIPETVFLAKTEIMPISTFDDYEYSAFNTFIINKESPGLNSYILKDLNNEDISLTINFQDIGIPNNNYLRQINKNYLFDLFIEKINQKELFVKGIKKFNIIKKENYQNIKDYDSAVIRLSSSIKISNTQKKGEPQFIEFETVSKKTWEELLYFVETSANSEIKDYLENNFKLFISSSNRLRKYSIEDIEFEIANNLEDELIVSKLKKIKKRKEENKIIERLDYLFSNTPIMKSDNFSASKFNIQSTKFKERKVENYSTKKVIIISIILGALLGIFYVLITNVIQKETSRDIIK